MHDHGTHQAVYLPDAARDGVGLAADRPGAAGPSCKDGLACGGPAQRDKVGSVFRAGDPWERVLEMGARQ